MVDDWKEGQVDGSTIGFLDYFSSRAARNLDPVRPMPCLTHPLRDH